MVRSTSPETSELCFRPSRRNPFASPSPEFAQPRTQEPIFCRCRRITSSNSFLFRTLYICQGRLHQYWDPNFSCLPRPLTTHGNYAHHKVHKDSQNMRLHPKRPTKALHYIGFKKVLHGFAMFYPSAFTLTL